MACEIEKGAFEQAIKSVADKLRGELNDVAQNVESKASEIAEKAKDGSDLAQGVGAVAGATVGGYFGGPAGAVVGATIGKVIGSQFVIEVTDVTYNASLDVPEIAIRDSDIIFDAPTIEMRDNDIVFNLPTLVMKRIDGPPNPVTVCTTETQCVEYSIPTPFGDIKDRKCIDVPVCKIEMRPTYLDVPTWEDREQRIVIGVPTIVMRQQRIVVGLPEITMKQTDISFSVPSITIRYAADAGKATAAAVDALQVEAKANLTQKQLSFRERMRHEVAPLGIAMFECYKQQIRDAISRVALMFDPQIEQVANALKSMRERGVPEADDDYINLKAKIDELIAKRGVAMSGLQDALAKLEVSANAALDQLVNGEG